MSYTILCKYNFPSLCAKLPFSWVQDLVSKAGQTVLECSSGQQLYLDSQMYYIPRALVEKILGREFFLIHIHMQIYVFLGHMAWNLLRIPCWCLVLFFFILAVTSVSTIGIAEMHPIIFLGISVYKIIQSFLITAGRYGLGHWCWRGNIIQSLMIDNYHHIEDSWWWDGSDHWVILAADD